MASETNQDAQQSNEKATGGLRPTTAMLVAEAIAHPIERPHFIRSLALHFAETTIFLLAVVGAIAMDSASPPTSASIATCSRTSRPTRAFAFPI